jgi:hypothetical protein
MIAILFSSMICGLPGPARAKHGGGGGNSGDGEPMERRKKLQLSPEQGQKKAPSAPHSEPSRKPRRESRAVHEPAQRKQEAPQGKPGRWPLSQALQSRGVTQAPHRFSRKNDILNSNRERSKAPSPREGMGGKALNHEGIPSRRFNEPVVRNQMTLIARSGSGFSAPQISVQLRAEASPGRYYWHHSDGFDYVHYNDSWGQPWFGWYVGSSYFWTRYHANRWWFYDDGFGRWSYWSGGSWYWQDPDNMSSVYLYSDGAYISIQ